jgi:predicted secreted Zn-dependent protease
MTPEAANTLVNLLTELWPKQAKELTPAMRSVWLRSFTAVDYKAVGDAIMALLADVDARPDRRAAGRGDRADRSGHR